MIEEMTWNETGGKPYHISIVSVVFYKEHESK
jgi:hypothetical protein